MKDTNQASEDELKKRIGNLHAYNYEGDDVTVKVMVDEDILESIAKFVEALIRTEKLKLLDRLHHEYYEVNEETLDTLIEAERNKLKEVK